MHWNCCIKTSCESGVGRFGGWLAAVGFPEARLRLKHVRWSGMAKECRFGKMLQFSGKEGLLETRTALQGVYCRSFNLFDMSYIFPFRMLD